MDGWTDGRTDGWMDGWMDGWIDGWMDELIDCREIVVFQLQLSVIVTKTLRVFKSNSLTVLTT